ncbi:MAG: penicillin-binding protein activator [Ghiorsea sp.]|nr:penicillin-binding protein activator [Ghiorsea sp.]
MLKLAYPFTLITAILLSATMLVSCGGGKKPTIHLDQQAIEKQAQQDAQQAKVDETQVMIDQLVEQSRLENPETYALDALYMLSQDPSIPEFSQGQAALAYAALLFEFERADAFTTSESILQQWSYHPNAVKLHLLLAQQWDILGNHEATIDELIAGLNQPSIDPYTLHDIIELAQPILSNVSEESSIQWLLAVSLHDIEHKKIWLQQAARYASLSRVLQIRRSDHPIQAEQADFYRYVARERLMVGDYHAVRVLAKILEVDLPDSEAAAIVKHWAENEGEVAVVGVMLPLTGKYAGYGQQALQGIRLAMSKSEFEDNIILRIQDTAGESDKVISAYYHLLAQGAQWIIGPLLSHNTSTITPYLINNIPVISLSSQVQLASESPALFIHSLAKTVQADFMAHYTLKQDKQRMVVIYDDNNSSTQEAAAFSQTFIDSGGEIIDMLALEEGIHDYRPTFVAMRERTDDEELLASLEEDLYLLSPSLEVDIKMPLNMDAIYIAASGKKIAVLAGQMAYSGITRIPLYGSHRWDDGHLLDDKGRYLSGAEFATPFTSLPQPNQAILDVQNQYRSIWADNQHISPLFALAYDTAMNIAVLGTRLGLKGEEAIHELRMSQEFPAISGNYYFDANGISQKTFAIQRVHRGKLKTIQITK